MSLMVNGNLVILVGNPHSLCLCISLLRQEWIRQVSRVPYIFCIHFPLLDKKKILGRLTACWPNNRLNGVSPTYHSRYYQCCDKWLLAMKRQLPSDSGLAVPTSNIQMCIKTVQYLWDANRRHITWSQMQYTPSSTIRVTVLETLMDRQPIWEGCKLQHANRGVPACGHSSICRNPSKLLLVYF